MRVSAILALLISVSVGQDKPAVPFGDIVSCARAGACRNMTAGTINWFDVVRIPVLTFKTTAGHMPCAMTQSGQQASPLHWPSFSHLRTRRSQRKV